MVSLSNHELVASGLHFGGVAPLLQSTPSPSVGRVREGGGTDIGASTPLPTSPIKGEVPLCDCDG